MIPLALLLQGGGSLMSYFQNKQQQEANNAIAAQNFANQERARQDALNEANRAFKLATATTKDAQGNTTSYNSSTGWETKLAPIVQSILNASQQQELRQRTAGAWDQQQEDNANYRRRLQEGQLADAQMTQMQQNYTPSQTTLEQILATQAAQSAGQANQALQRGAALSAVRSNSDASQTLANMAKAGSDAARTNGMDTYLGSFDAASKISQGNQNAASLMNMLASRASDSKNTPYTPTQAGSGIDDRMAAMSTNAQNALTNKQSAASMTGGQMDYVKANNSLGSMLSSLGSMYGGYKSNQQNQQNYDQLVKQLGLSGGNMTGVTGGGPSQLGQASTNGTGSMFDYFKGLFQ